MKKNFNILFWLWLFCTSYNGAWSLSANVSLELCTFTLPSFWQTSFSRTVFDQWCKFFFFYIRLISGEHLLVLLIYMRSDTNPKYTPLNFDFHHKIIRRIDTKHFTRSYSPLECYICVVLVILYYNYLKIIYVIMLHPCLYSYPYWCMYFLDQKKKKKKLKSVLGMTCCHSCTSTIILPNEYWSCTIWIYGNDNIILSWSGYWI